MGVKIESDNPLPCWADKANANASSRDFEGRADALRIALVNNMPDAALEDTELQFLELLNAACGDVPVIVRLFSLPNVPRSDRGEQHLAKHYSGIDELWRSRVDGMIITGTEPRQPNLRDEPYWREMTDVFDWAEKNTTSTVLSCLAAHAGVLHSDDIRRHPLGDKKLGVFETHKIAGHDLLRGAPGAMRFPHSRWNEVKAEELAAAGYSTILLSSEAGVDMFVKKRGNCLFVHFQGHPEYGARTLSKEYRRDIKRFLRGERPNYPTMPLGYFDEGAAKRLEAFRVQALTARNEDWMGSYPEEEIAGDLRSTWHEGAVSIYRNWLRYISENKNSGQRLFAVSRADRT